MVTYIKQEKEDLSFIFLSYFNNKCATYRVKDFHKQKGDLLIIH